VPASDEVAWLRARVAELEELNARLREAAAARDELAAAQLAARDARIAALTTQAEKLRRRLDKDHPDADLLPPLKVARRFVEAIRLCRLEQRALNKRLSGSRRLDAAAFLKLLGHRRPDDLGSSQPGDQGNLFLTCHLYQLICSNRCSPDSRAVNHGGLPPVALSG
jgi:hypothetical protein